MWTIILFVYLLPLISSLFSANQPQADPFNIFEHFGFGNMGGRGRQEEPHTDNVDIPVYVSLRQLYVGELLDVSYVRQVVCPEAASCQTNDKDCQGPGVRIRMQQLAPGFVQQVQVQDSNCVARGKQWKPNCKACPRGMTEPEEIDLTLELKPGAADGETIKFDQIADEAVGHISGDVNFHIKQTIDPVYTRNGNNLEMSITISLLDSLVGFRRTFKHLDNHEFVVEKRDVSYCSQVVVVKNQGMPIKGSKNQFGDLHVTLLIDFPSHFTLSQKESLRKILA